VSDWIYLKHHDQKIRPGFRLDESDLATFSILSNSAGGPAARDYVLQLEIILECLKRIRASIARIEVESGFTEHLGISDRVLQLAFPVVLGPLIDVPELRKQISAAQKTIGQGPSDKGGNGNRRIRLHISTNASKEEFLRVLQNSESLDDSEQSRRQIEEDEIELRILNRKIDGPVEKTQLVRARRGQGAFRQNVLSREPRCRVTGTSDPRFLRASHIKPWRDSTDVEKIDGDNGLMLAPHVDALFDRGYVTVGENGALLISAQINPEILRAWGIDAEVNLGVFNDSQSQFLQYHRENVFRP
jgi:hypothetical protein